jgi:hypothetical protein
LESRIAKGRPTVTEAVMFFDDNEALMLESGQLDSFVTGPEFGTGEAFRMGAFSEMSFAMGQAFSPRPVLRTMDSEMIGTYGEFASRKQGPDGKPQLGVSGAATEPYFLEGESFVHRGEAIIEAPKLKEVEADNHDEVVVRGDTLTISWSKHDIIDTYRRVSRGSPKVLGGLSIRQAWESMKRGNTLFKKQRFRHLTQLWKDDPNGRAAAKRELFGE